MVLRVDYLMAVLPIMGTGMLGIFLVTGVISMFLFRQREKSAG